MKFIFLTVLFLFLQQTFAQDSKNIIKELPAKSNMESTEQTPAPLPLPEEKFAAIVQHASGKPKVDQDEKKQEIDFKDIIKFGATIEVPKKSRLKLITQKRCVAVFYENTKIKTPDDKGSPWTILSGNVRWICSEDKIERVLYKNSELDVQNGEFLMTQNQLVPYRNKISFQGKPLAPKTMYTFKKNQWIPLEDQPEAYEVWALDKKYPYPTESSRQGSLPPDDPSEIRFFANLIPTGISGFYHHEQESRMSAFDMETHGLRIGTNFPWKNKSIIAFLEFQEAENDENKQHHMGPPNGSFKGIKTETFTAALGLRKSHTKSSSFYYYAGLTKLNYIFRYTDNPFIYEGKINYNWNISAGGGYQKTFFPKNWISLMVGIEAKIMQSLGQGSFEYFNQPPAGSADPRSTATSYSAIVYLGPVFNF